MSATFTPKELPVLAGAAGKYREGAPRAELQRSFQCVWTHVLPGDAVGDVAVVPDGCVDLVWRAGRLRVVGPDVVAAHPDLGPGAEVLGIRFRPGAARRWLGVPLSEIVGLEVALSDLHGDRARAFAHRMEDAGSFAQQARVFEAQLAAASACDGAVPDPGAAEIFRLMAQPGADEGRQLSQVRERLDLGERSLRRHCHDHFGYGPKTLARILRFQRLLTMTRALPDAGLAALAIDNGYADQAHLSREVKALSGMSARTLVDQARP